MTQRNKERLGGLFILIIGAAFTALCWYDAQTQSYFYLKAAVMGPAFAAIGLGLLLFGGYRSERAARGEDVSRLQGFRLITPRWWLMLAVGISAGLFNWYLLARPIP